MLTRRITDFFPSKKRITDLKDNQMPLAKGSILLKQGLGKGEKRWKLLVKLTT
jgi:hypothetical protein